MIQHVEVVGEFKFHNWVVNIYDSLEDPLFRAVDIARIIDYSVGNTYKMIEDLQEGLDKFSVHTNSMNRHGNKKPEWYLTEFGLYEVLFRSTKPIAKEFKITVKQILRDIRKTGKFEVRNFTENSFDYLEEERKEMETYLEENYPGYTLSEIEDPYVFNWSNPPGGIKD